MGGKEAVFINDLDDTLVHTTWRYELTHFLACAYVLEFVGANAHQVTQLLELRLKIDNLILEECGFSEGYYEKSLQKFLDEVCAFANVTPNAQIRKKLSNLAKYPFDSNNYTNADLIDGAKEALKFQSQEKFSSYIVTRGIESVQKAKIANLGFYEFVAPKNVFVVNKNSKISVLEKIAAKETCKQTYVVEDSLALVNAATDAGFNAIFIPEKRGSQVREKGNGKIKNLNLTIPLEGIIEVKTQYGKYRTAQERKIANDLPDYIKQYL